MSKRRPRKLRARTVSKQHDDLPARRRLEKMWEESANFFQNQDSNVDLVKGFDLSTTPDKTVTVTMDGKLILDTRAKKGKKL